MRRWKQLLDQEVERALAISECLGHVRVQVAGAVSIVQLYHARKRFLDARHGGVEPVKDHWSVHIDQYTDQAAGIRLD